ncbi:hypothetical protein TSUD_29340 [Trifolium subterraneum]|uniref:Reverse transcriptase zinc-binding domain-containing protein n=1 Tax=Trifolium subterraneum TaxID=3900 RepID=A0A2Z6MXV5_TRISU|nr:hypothetical protein TSUD_29340 [Trifolium subterraneum]
MKMLWNMINKPNELWCKVVYNKYGRNKDLRFGIKSQPYNSPLWKAIAGIWDQFHQHIWMDRWVPNGSLLMPTATNEIIDSILIVKDVLTSEGNWDLNFLYNNLRHNIVNQVVALPAPRETDGPDLVGWRGTNTHHFTVWSAYDLQQGNVNRIKGDWSSIWNWKGPHKIQTFMWKWFFKNLGNKEYRVHIEGWKTIFMVACWFKMLLGTAAYCETQMVVGYGDTLKRLEVVTPYMFVAVIFGYRAIN